MIITVTLNPAMDKVLVVDSFRLNVTNRIQEQFYCIGGKGTHISFNLSLLGVRSMAIGVVMGQNGGEILKTLQSMNIDVQFLQLPEGNSRLNYALVDGDGNCTLIAEKGQLMDTAVIERLISHYTERVHSGDIVVISGDASNQKHTGLQDTLMDIAAQKGARVCLDASGEHLAAGIKKAPFFIKPNANELSMLAGRELESEAEIIEAMREISAAGVRNVVVSLGGEGSLACSDGSYFRITAPQVEVRNTVGCGDALVAGILAGFEKGLEIEENLRQATAIASAAAMSKATVGFDAALLPELAGRVVIKPL